MIKPKPRGIYIADMRNGAKLGKHRSAKHCVCVSVGSGIYLLINTNHRKMYEDFPIKASDYEFLNEADWITDIEKKKILEELWKTF